MLTKLIPVGLILLTSMRIQLSPVWVDDSGEKVIVSTSYIIKQYYFVSIIVQNLIFCSGFD